MIPIVRWFRTELSPYLEDQLHESRIPEFIERQAVRRLLKEHASGKGNHTNLLWALLLLTRWIQKFRVTAAGFR
jgi:asparagine synthase (glutamine-hydrolysing)